MNTKEHITPAMWQYYDIKNEYADCIIFFRMWDFYEMFGEDAHIAHRVLWINITSRNKNAKNPESLAGFPYHAKDKYLPQLVNAWYKVAIVEQVSDPKLKGIVKREVMRVVTPATLALEENYEVDQDSLMISVSYSWNIYGLSLLNISNSTWQASEFVSFDELQKELFKLSPKEVVLQKSLYQNDDIKQTLLKKHALNIYYFDFIWDPKQKLLSHFGTKSLEWFGIEKLPWAILSSALLLGYLELNQKTTLSQLSSLAKYDTSTFLQIDAQTMRNLDILFNLSTGSQTLGTLFWVLNHTKTSMGKRYLKENLVFPLRNQGEIDQRLEIVEEIKNHTILASQLRDKLGYISDLDAILNRLSLGRVSPKDLISLKKSLQAILEIQEIIKKYWSKKLNSFFIK